ncbi:MAG: 4-alpha-glucanotransferase [Miltoncostaeaceae bacterium]
MPTDPTHRRAAGVLLHASALPGGTLAGAPRFIDWLARAGQSWWQVLPLGPPDEFGSPYAGASAFAGWPGLLGQPGAPVSEEERDDLRSACAYWIDDWERHAGPGALDDQVRFAREWGAVRAYAAERGVGIMGDVPFYVAAGSADHCAHPGLFLDDVVAGVPPDDFSADGQLWGNPPYDWRAMASDGYRWWVERLRRAAQLADAVRIDHFRGFAAWWAVPAGATTATRGEWRPGPGEALFRRLAEEGPDLGLIAEDLGIITPDVVALIERLGLPGIRVLQYAFNDDPYNPHRLENHQPRAMVVTGTHDNDTIAGWWGDQPGWVRDRALIEVASWGVHEAEPHRGMVRLALASPAGLAVIPAQDLLGLGSEARFNTPGTTRGNWSWRLPEGALDDELADWLGRATDHADRRPLD